MKIIYKTLIVLIFIGGIAFGLWQGGCVTIRHHNRKEEIYQSFSSPDGNFKLIVYRNEESFSLPGQSGDASGYIELIDQNEKVLKRKEIEMVQVLESDIILWKTDYVFIGPLSIKWELPIKNK